MVFMAAPFSIESNSVRSGRVWIIALVLMAAMSGNGTAESLAPTDYPVITAIRIDIVDYPDPRGEIQGLVRELLLLKGSDQFSPSKLEKSIRTLRETDRFDL